MSEQPPQPLEDRGEASLPQLRERAEPSATEGSMPVWLIVVAGLVAAGGFAYLGRHVSSFSGDQFTDPGYVAVGPQDGSGQVAEKSPLDELMELGSLHYNTCGGCHGADGGGGSAPPLAGSEWVSGPTQRLGMIILHGLQGPISVKGQQYNLNMAPIGGAYNAKDLAAVMTYVRVSFGDADMIEPENLVVSEEVASNIMAIDHSGQMTAAGLEANHNVYTEGQKLDPDTGEPM